MGVPEESFQIQTLGSRSLGIGSRRVGIGSYLRRSLFRLPRLHGGLASVGRARSAHDRARRAPDGNALALRLWEGLRRYGRAACPIGGSTREPWQGGEWPAPLAAAHVEGGQRSQGSADDVMPAH